MPELHAIEDIEAPPYDGTADNGAKKRGRPAGSTNTGGTRSRTTAADRRNIETALASMGTLYSSAAAGLMLANRPVSAAFLASRIDELQVSNKQAFEASPRLAAAISSIGQFSAIGLFISTNVAVFGMVAMSARVEGAANREQAESAAQHAEQGNTSL